MPTPTLAAVQARFTTKSSASMPELRWQVGFRLVGHMPGWPIC